MINNIVKNIVNGDVRTAAKLIRDIDDSNPETRNILKALHRHTGKAYVIGIKGALGVGKSTLVDQMIHGLRVRGKTVGVLAVDPTSPFSGGAILGDRIRMQRHSLDEGGGCSFPRDSGPIWRDHAIHTLGDQCAGCHGQGLHNR